MNSTSETRMARKISSQTVNTVVVYLSKRVFALTWCVIMLLHIACAIYYYYVIKLHLFLKGRDYTALMGPTFTHYFDAVIVASSIFAGGHVLSICVPLFISIGHRELTFDVSFRNKKNRITSEQSVKIPTSKALSIAKNAIEKCTSWLSIEHPYFFEIFVVREIIESVCQTYQAYQLSSLISTIWINRVFALVIVLNCWNSPLINVFSSWREHRRTKTEVNIHTNEKESIRKLGYLTCDMLFNGVSSIIIPVVIISSYVRDYEHGHGDFPFILYYNDTWFIKAVAENSQLFVRSWVDFISKELPGISILTSLYTIRSGIRPNKVRSTTVINDSSENRTNGPKQVEKHRFRMFHWISHTILFVLGLGVLLLHLYATSVAELNKIPGCLLEIRPWFSTQYNCVVMELNCDRILESVDTPTTIVDMDDVLAPLAPWSVRSVILSSCPQLVMPTRITSFNRLLVLKLYNSTIHEWTRAAALEVTKHPEIQFLFIIETNMSTLPDGLLSPDFPSQLQDIEISGTNLSTLPTNLHEVWGITDEELNLHQYVDCFVFENIYGGLKEVPSTLAKPGGLEVRLLSLSGTGLPYVPEHFLWANSTIAGLEISSNPILYLPDRDPDCGITSITAVFCENLVELPLWATNATGNELKLFLGGTPICDRKDLMLDENSDVQIICTVRPGPYTEYFFPREYEHAQRLESRLS